MNDLEMMDCFPCLSMCLCVVWQSSPSIALQQICSLVEYLFTTVLPVPEPWTPALAASGAPSPWIPVEVTLTHQRAVLRALNRICVHYVSAAKSLKYDRMQVCGFVAWCPPVL